MKLSRRRYRDSIGARSRTEESRARRSGFHAQQVQKARTGGQQLAACFDRYRAACSRHGHSHARAATEVFMDHAKAMWDLGEPTNGRLERFAKRITAAKGDLGKMRAAYDWYRAEAAALSRIYGEDPDYRRFLAEDMRNVAGWLNSQAMALEG